MRLREKIQKISSTQNESIDEELSNDLKQMMAEQTDHVAVLPVYSGMNS